MHDELIAKAAELVRRRSALGAPEGPDLHCVLALLEADGSPTASTVTAARADGLARLYFDTGADSRKARRIRRDPRASVCFADADYNITLTGRMEVRTDPETKRAMWYPGMANHFSGPDDPNYAVLAFTTERYNLLVDWREAEGALTPEAGPAPEAPEGDGGARVDFGHVEIVERPAKRLVGIFVRTTMERAREDCPALWARLMPAIAALTGDQAYDSYGVSAEAREDGSFIYWAALDAPEDLLRRPDWVEFLPPARVRVEGAATIDLPGGRYVAAWAPSLAALPAVHGFLYGEWAKGRSDYTVDFFSPCFEHYPRGWRENDPVRVFVPLKNA